LRLRRIGRRRPPAAVAGGWGVDALIGCQTRAHRDVAVDIDATCEEAALRVLGDLGYVIETDRRPNRVELVAHGRGWVDLHPLLLEPDGSARQAALGGVLPHLSTVVLHRRGMPVPCVSAEAQHLFGTGTSPGRRRP
jgi:lincosamide nucleotidyltransferase A/C/D/E